MYRKTLTMLAAILLAAAFVALTVATPALANPPYPEDKDAVELSGDLVAPGGTTVKPVDRPNPKDYLRLQERWRLLEAGELAEAEALAQTGTDRVLVILVEFAGTDTFTWTAPTVPYSYTTGSQWDPLGIADPDEYTGVVGDCTLIQEKIAADHGLTITDTWGMSFTFTYEGPLHNMIERPISSTDRSAETIWTSDFDPQWFDDFMFDNGVAISYTMQSGESVYESFIGQSVKDYYSDMSSGVYTITGDVVGWVGVPHSTWYYDADQCPGARSGTRTNRGEFATTHDLVRDTLDQVNAISNTIPGFDWANYDIDGDGVIDRLWIVHAGLGEEDSTTLLNRDPVTGTNRTTPYPEAFYGEGAVWSHSSQISTYSVTQDIAAGPYIIMPENGGIGVFAHEYGHNLGADDLYAYDLGETSTGFWSLMADDWTGYPIGFEPPAVDPWHLDRWGWLEPMVITDTSQVYEFTLGQASRFETSGGDYRGAKIELPDGILDLPAAVWSGNYYWWGGKENVANAMMTTKNPIAVSAGMTLSFDLAYDIEGGGWDFLWVQVSTDNSTWETLTNANTQCDHNPSWIGGEYGFPEDLCGAGIGGFYGHNATWPVPGTEVFDLDDYAGENIYLRFWYMTDWGTLGSGPFIDNVELGGFFDNAEGGDGNWDYDAPWERSNGTQPFNHNLYLQWRNTDVNTGGYDSALGEERWRFGPANTGLLVWYNNNFYIDNEVYHYLDDDFAYGPKGRMLVIDSHPEPYYDPYAAPDWRFGDENTTLTSRGLMRDAPFSLWDTNDFTYTLVQTPTHYSGRPAVPSFHDSLGYYPGFGMGGAWGYYSLVDWDASATVPAKAPYSTQTPGGVDIPDWGSVLYGPGWYYANLLPVEGGSGDPRDAGVQYGWHVEILDQTNMTATVRVWNTVVTQEPLDVPTDIMDYGTYTMTYGVQVMGDASDSTVTVTVPSEVTVMGVSPMTTTQPSATTFVWENPTLSATEWTTFVVTTTYMVDSQELGTLLTGHAFVNDGSTSDTWSTDFMTQVWYKIYLPIVAR